MQIECYFFIVQNWPYWLTFLFIFSPEGLRSDTQQLLNSTSKKKGKGGGKGGPANEEEPKADSQPVSIHLHFKRYVFDPHKKMVQSWPLLHILHRHSAGDVERAEAKVL